MPDGVVAPIDARALRASEVLTLRTRHGDLDLLAHPEPGFGFEALAASARTAELMGIRVLVASLDDLIAMKRAAGRPKDRIELEILGAVREELDRSGA
jgi:predicted nucleotidyltransferase